MKFQHWLSEWSLILLLGFLFIYLFIYFFFNITSVCFLAQVKPLISSTPKDAKTRVLSLYKVVYKFITSFSILFIWQNINLIYLSRELSFSSLSFISNLLSLLYSQVIILQAWYRHIPYMVKDYSFAPTVKDCRYGFKIMLKNHFTGWF